MRIAEHAPNHTLVHAGVASFRGHRIMLPGHSFAGKTTIVADFVRASAMYYSAVSQEAIPSRSMSSLSVRTDSRAAFVHAR